MFELYNKEIKLVDYIDNNSFNENEQKIIQIFINDLIQLDNCIIDSTEHNYTLYNFIKFKFEGNVDILSFMHIFVKHPKEITKQINKFILTHIET